MENKASKIITKTLTVIFATVLIAGAVVGGYWLISRWTASFDKLPEEVQMRRLASEVNEVQPYSGPYYTSTGEDDFDSIGAYYEQHKNDSYYYCNCDFDYDNWDIIFCAYTTITHEEAVAMFNKYAAHYPLILNKYKNFDEMEMAAWKDTGYPFNTIEPHAVIVRCEGESFFVEAYGKVGNSYVWGAVSKR